MIKLVKSSFHDEGATRRALAEFVLSQDIFSMSEQCRAFERAFAARQDRRHAVYVSSGSVANLLLVQALVGQGVFARGDRIGFSALTWPRT